MDIKSSHNTILKEDQDFQLIEPNQKDFKSDFSFGDGRFFRRVLFSQCLKTLIKNRQKVVKIEQAKKEGKQQTFEMDDIPGIKKQESMHEYSKTLNDELKKLLKEDDSGELVGNHLLKGLMIQFKWDILLILFCLCFESSCRLGFSIMLFQLLQVVMDLQNQSIEKAYLLAFFAGLLWFVGQCFMHNAFLQITIFMTKMRSSLVGLIFKKITQLSQYTVKSQQIGKIINMFANDFNLIQLKILWFFPAASSPIIIIGAIILLVTRLGWFGLICPLVILSLIPVQLLIGRLNGKILKNINTYKDERVKACTQMIEGIKFIKLYGWQVAFKQIISKLRKAEIKNYMKLSVVKSFERGLGNSIALWAGFICFLVMHFTGQGESLNTATIFSTLEILVTLRLSLFCFGIGSGFYFELQVILERYASIMNLKDQRMIKVVEGKKQTKNTESNILKSSQDHMLIQLFDEPSLKQGQIKFNNFNGFWNQEELDKPSLKNINLHIKKGDFCGITGKVGSGKSGLLGVILQEIPYYSGYTGKDGVVAYVEQQPVLFSCSVKENILFSRKFDEERYRNALRDSCLQADLELLESGQNTIVGEKGVTLSGGQKARLALARAVYTDADIYLFDDPISAVDSKVAKQIYERVILKLWKEKKTVILVTHQISYLRECNQVIIMDNGAVAHNDKPEKLKEELKKFELSEMEEEIKEEVKDQKSSSKSSQKTKVVMESIPEEDPGVVNLASQKKEQLKKQEDVDVTCNTYRKFILLVKINFILFPFTIIVFLASEGLNSIYFRFLAGYGDLFNGVHDLFGSDDSLYMGILGLVLFCHFVLFIVKYTMFQMVVLYSNQELHKVMIQGLVRSPCSYFDTTPTGQLTNRFSNDLGVLDTLLGFIAIDALEGPIYIIASMINIFIIDYFFIVPGLMNLLGLVLLLTFCNGLIVNAKKLDLKMKNPIFSTVNEVISGLVQIRVFNRRRKLLQEFNNIVNDSYRSTINFWICSRTLGVYGSYISLIILIIGFVLGVRNIESNQSLASDSSLAGLYGVTIVFLLQINDNVQWPIRQINYMESIMVSSERSFLMKDLEPEKPLRTNYDKTMKIQKLNNIRISSSNISSQNQMPMKWPTRGNIVIKNLSLKYRPQLPLVLNEISLTIQEGEKVGIVGRTGAGKSSIIQALFRIVEPEEGSVYEIDGCDALKLGLHTLRHRLSVIPQLPFLFKGDIKTNLDPFSKHSEEVLWDALESAGLKDSIEKLPEKLQTNVSNIAEVFSVGQKQLLCLARALLRNNKFLILDEATSNVDMETDYFIQKCIHTKFQNTTVITIAHRLNTIADYDKVIVMSRGRIIEIGEPHRLIQNDGAFAQMVSHTGKNADLIRKIAKNSFEARNRS